MWKLQKMEFLALKNRRLPNDRKLSVLTSSSLWLGLKWILLSSKDLLTITKSSTAPPVHAVKRFLAVVRIHRLGEVEALKQKQKDRNLIKLYTRNLSLRIQWKCPIEDVQSEIRVIDHLNYCVCIIQETVESNKKQIWIAYFRVSSHRTYAGFFVRIY